MMRRQLILTIGMTLAGGCVQEEQNGQELAASKGCVACHSTSGAATEPIYPNLTGQWESYLRQQLYAYRSGHRKNVVMNGMAAELTDREIRALAKHYGREP